jgi:hypothetical protein
MKLPAFVFISIFFSLSAAADATCHANCRWSCGEELYTESPDQFSQELCAERGGTYGTILDDGEFACIKDAVIDLDIVGTGDVPASAERDAEHACYTQQPAECNTYMATRSVTEYQCETN